MNQINLCFPIVALTLILSCCSFPSEAADWTQFRGPDGSGVVLEKPMSAGEWSGTPDTHWSTDLPGTGWSSPVFSGKFLWLTSAITKAATEEEIAERFKDEPYPDIKTIVSSVELHALCLDVESGKLLKDILLLTTNKPDPVNPLNSYASPTPAIAEGKVICHFGSYGTWCLDLETGKEIWKRQYVVDHSVGPGSSPVIGDDRLFLICDGMDKQFVVALDLQTGEELWKTSRPPKRAENPELRKAFSTPLLIQVNNQKQLVAPSAQWFIAYDPANGKEIWRVDHGKGFSVTPMPFYDSGLLICATGYPELKLFAIDPGGQGDVTNSYVKWTTRNAPAMPSMVSKEDRIYAMNDKGILNCFDLKTGNRVTRKRIGGNFSASPLILGEMMYLSSREGKMTILKSDDSLNILAVINFEEPIMASPAVIGQDLIIRTRSKLIRIPAAW